MSTDKKESIGFRTKAKTIEEQYSEIFQMLDSKNKDWVEIANALKSFRAMLVEQMGKEFEKPKPDVNAMFMAIQLSLTMYAIESVARLGADVTEIHKRITRLEKKLAPKVE